MKTSAECLLILKELEIIVTRWYEIDRYLYFHVSPSITNNEIEKVNKSFIDPEYFISYNCFSVNLEKQLTDIKNPTPIHHFNTKIKNIIETNFQL